MYLYSVEKQLLKKYMYTEERGNLLVQQGRRIWEAGLGTTRWIISAQQKWRQEFVLLDSTLLMLLQKAWMWESAGVSQASLHNIPRGRPSHGLGPWATTAISDWLCQSSAGAQRSSGTQHKDSHTALLGPERVPLVTYCTDVAAHSRSPKQHSPPMVSENRNSSSLLRVKRVRSERWRAKVQLGEGQATKSKLELNNFWRLVNHLNDFRFPFFLSMSFRILDSVTEIFSIIVDKYQALEILSNRHCNCKLLLHDPG